MAANKFATMLHRNTNKITLILVYAVLEWILILLLLLNSLFSYLIVKFADFFGLKRPCLWCSRLDHIFEPQNSKNFHRDLICEAHAKEISKLGYCLNHRRLAESRDMCEDCSSSSDCHEWSNKFAFFPWMKQIGMVKEGGDNDKVVEENGGGGEENSKCSCCGESLSTRFYPPYILINPPWGVLDYAQKKDFIEEEEEEGNIDAHTYEGDHSDHSRSDFVADHHEEDEQGIEENTGIETVFAADERSEKRREVEEVKETGSFSETNFFCREIEAGEDEETDMVIEKEQEEEEKPIQAENLEVSMDEQENISKDTSSETPVHQHLEFFIGQEDCTLIPIELVESAANENRIRQKYKVEDERSSTNLDVILDFDMNVVTESEQVTETWHSSGEMLELLSANKNAEETKLVEVVESKDLGDESRNSFEFLAEERDLETRQFQQLTITRATQIASDDEDGDNDDDGQAMAGGESDLEVHQGSEDDIHMQSDEIDGEISIGTEIPDQEPIDEIDSREIPENVQEDLSSSSVNLHIDDSHDFGRAEEELVEFKTSSVEINQKEMNNQLVFCSELSDIEEDRVPDTPNSIDSLHQLHKKLLLLERRESGAEESLDGSVMSDIEGGDGIPVVEKLKSALKAERKALSALYVELEEERSASAEAASQTMAMINRLQEERAAMQMEALQYQRMMEEQSEYDQEALQLLNELMMKREREKQELEKELEMYRKRVQEYEAKERMLVKRMKDGSTRSMTSSISCSNAEDSDGLSIDLNNEAKEEDITDGHEENGNQNTPADAVLYLEESLAGFEEERLSILDQLRLLEEKLFTLSDGEDQHFEDIKSIEHLYKDNGNGYHEDLDIVNGEVNGVVTNGHSKEMNGKHHHQERRIMGAKAKRLLPYFDAAEAEAEDGVLNGNVEGFDYVSMQNSSVIEFEQDGKKLAVEEEVDHVYERLQALEADREFLKHCISSLRKGDKGLYLLQEILQHLRDLRSVEHRVKNLGDVTLS
ncbi:hypothetical protein TIFTF001_007749 [Ficus carica]|uniref:GTD-binding domain-containing protein n=1 Tax=Ficus carica TaxID=3494 RepID=A0AA88D297_FICCA|nr:hypothetical protein TIFTF001_007749 [Ficus carica]